MLFLRAAGDPGTLGEAIRREVQAVDPTVRRFAVEVLGVFAAAAFLLASVGIYGVAAYTFSRRIGEIGRRMALGAQRSDILKIVLQREAASRPKRWKN